MKKLLFTIGLTVCLTANAQTEVSEYIPGIHAEGVTYFLPQTAIDITVVTEKVTYTPGDFCHYANKYLRLQGISDTPDTYWEIKHIDIKPVGIVDPEKGYTIKLKDKSVAPLVELSEEGLLLSINNKKEETVVNTTPTPLQPAQHIDPKELLGEEILSATSTAKMAELVAKEIYNIRDSRNAIIRGQADNMPKDGEALKLILQTLEAQDEALTSMFRGITNREQRTISIRLLPTGEETNREVLFRFSRKLGIVAANDLSGAPVYYDLANLTNLPQPDEKANKKAKRPQGVVYNIPGKTLLKVYRNNEVLFDEEIPVAQLGNTDVLAADLFNKNATTKVTFDPATGAIRKIERE